MSNPTYFTLPDSRMIRIANLFSAKAASLVNAYNGMDKNSTIRTIYAKPSKEKVEAYEAILREAYFVGGYDVRVGRANTFSFSMGYKVNTADGRIILIYHTASRTQAAIIGAYT